MSPRQPKLVSAGVWTSRLWVRRGAASRHKRMKRSWRKVGCSGRRDGKEEWRGADKACKAEEEIRGEVRG